MPLDQVFVLRPDLHDCIVIRAAEIFAAIDRDAESVITIITAIIKTQDNNTCSHILGYLSFIAANLPVLYSFKNCHLLLLVDWKFGDVIKC